MNDYTKRTEVMNPPVSAAQGTEVGNLNTVQRHGTGAVPQGMEAQATQPSAAPTECKCPPQTCHPEDNERAYCWRSGCYIPAGYFSRHSHTSFEEQK